MEDLEKDVIQTPDVRAGDDTGQQDVEPLEPMQGESGEDTEEADDIWPDVPVATAPKISFPSAFSASRKDFTRRQTQEQMVLLKEAS